MREKAMKKYFLSHTELRRVLTTVSIHSEDEVDDSGTRFRLKLPWRSKDLGTFVHELDKLYINCQTESKDHTTAIKTLERGKHREMDEEQRVSCHPPKGLPGFMVSNTYLSSISKALKEELRLSHKNCDIQALIEEARTWRKPDTGRR